MDYLAAWMFLALTILLLAGFPVTFTLLGTALTFGIDRIRVGFFQPVAFAHLGPYAERNPGSRAPVRVHGGHAGAFWTGRRPVRHHGAAFRSAQRRVGRIRGGGGRPFGASTGIVGATVSEKSYYNTIQPNFPLKA